MESLLQDLRYAVRSLRKSPGFAAVAMATVALGIGANVAIYSVVRGVLLTPLAFERPDQLVYILNTSNTATNLLIAAPDLVDMQELASLFEDVGARVNSAWDATLTGGDEPIHVRGGTLTANLLDILGVEPFLGRGFVPEDAPEWSEQSDTAAPPTWGAMLSYDLWQRAFGGDPDIVGNTVYLSGGPTNVVAVLPEGFDVPRSGVRASESEMDLWYPQFIERFRGWPRRGRSFIGYGRLKPGVTVEQAQAEMDALYARLREEEATYANENIRVRVTPLLGAVVQGIRPTLVVLAGAVACLLLLACSNVANLLLVRARGRRGETAVRAALGCGRLRLARQVLTESSVIAGVGGLLGLGLGWAGVRVLVALRPVGLPRLDAVSVDAGVLIFAVGATVLATLLFGSFPALQTGRTRLTEVLKDQTRGSGGGRRRALLDGLVVVEVALSMVLLSGAALMVRTSFELQGIRPGFEPEGAMTFSIGLYEDKYWEPGAQVAFLGQLDDRLRALPGVESVGSTNAVPLGGGRFNGPYSWDESSEASWPAARASYRSITGDYFRAVGSRLQAGRMFNQAELTEDSRSVIVDEKLARDAWPSEDPLGKVIVAGRWRDTVEVVGVVEHARHFRLTQEGYGAVFWPGPSLPMGMYRYVVRTSGDPAALTNPIRAEVRAMDPGLALHQVSTLEALVGNQLAPTRFALLLLGIFAGLAVLLASVGLYGVISYAVRQRTAEIGIRMAFGAEAGRILRMVVGGGARLTGLGVLVGVAGTLVLSRFLSSLVYGVSATDPITLGAVAVVLATVGLLASYVPARHATRVDPISALRAE